MILLLCYIVYKLGYKDGKNIQRKETNGLIDKCNCVIKC